MSRFFQLLAGPELLWLFIYGAVTVLAKSNVPPTKGTDRFNVSLAFFKWLAIVSIGIMILNFIIIRIRG